MKKRQSFLNRMAALFLISIVIPILIMAAILAYYFQKKLYQEKDSYFSTSLYSISTNLSTCAQEMMRLSLTPYVYDDILNFYTAIENGSYTENGSRDYRIERYRQSYITAIQRILITARDDILAVSFMPADPDNPLMVTTSKYNSLLDDTSYQYEKEAWYPSILTAQEPFDFLVSEDLPYIDTNTKVISAVHAVRNIDTKKILGVIRIDASDARIEDSFRSVVLSPHSGFVILNQENQPVYQVGYVEQAVLRALAASTGSAVKTPQDTYDLYSSEIAGVPWRLIFVSSQKDIRREVSIIWFLAALLSLASILAALFIFRSNSKKTSRALNSILDTMEQVAHGNLDASVPNQIFLKNDSFSTEEFSLLADHLNRMIRKLQIYIDRSYKYEISRQEAEYKALQSQINPHFLYNTLNCFISMNRIGMKKELETSILQLTKMFRYTCSNAKLTTVREEFDFCAQYCGLMKIRCEDRLTFCISMAEEAADISIPRLLIQPLIENAIKHGMEREGKAITLWIEASVRNGILILEERNDGTPIQLEQIHSPGKVGILNVESRVKLFCPQAEFHASLTNGMTAMTIQIPLEGGDNKK